MNQHASRPVAQGFPLHRRPIQSGASSGRTSTPLRRPANPSVMTSEGPLRRFKSQIPIRIGFRTHSSTSSSSSQQTSLRARVLERHRLSTSQASTATIPAIRTPSSTSQQQQPPIDVAFKVYEDRLQTNFGEFRAMCFRLVLKEREEKEKWHTLCLKMMKERDTARQRVSALVSERETHLSSSSSVPASAKENIPSKRARDETTTTTTTTISSTVQELVVVVPSRSSPTHVESRPIRGLRLSPISPAPRSPPPPSYNSSTVINTSLPSTSTFTPPSSETTVTPTPCSESLVTPPLDITTFNPPRSPNDKTCFDVFGEFDIPESRPVKRRRSTSDKKSVQTVKDGEVKEDKGDDDDEPLPFLIDHTDIMYVPMKGRLFCRACLLDKTINPSSSSSSSRNPKTFPTTVCWDELRDHCVSEHPKACADVARLCPADLNELRRRLYNV